ncbi:MAG: hypothetical protein R3D25_02005 [Geminicoccaceae bacterium]
MARVVGEARVTTASTGSPSRSPGWTTTRRTGRVEHYHDTAARALSILGVGISGTALDPAGGTQDVGPRDGKVILGGEAATTITYNGTWYVQVPAARLR